MDKKVTTVEYIMTKKVISLKPDDTLDVAAQLFEKHNFDGFPVVDERGKLSGLLTAYDMVLQSAKIHLPLVLSFLRSAAGGYGIGGTALEEQFAKLKEIKVRDVMNIDPLIVGAGDRVDDLAKEFVEHHRVNPIPVVDSNRNLLGVVSRYDVIRFFNQNYLDEILRDSGHTGILKRLTRIEDKDPDA